MKQYSFEDISKNWEDEGVYLFNQLAVDDNVCDIDKALNIINDIINSDDELCMLCEGKHTKKKHKRYASALKLSPSEYVAKKCGNNIVSKSGKSFYDHTHTIKIKLNDSTVVEGEIRISNHEIDLDKWMENNTHDFGIGIVVYENVNELIGNNIVTLNGRILNIYEYLFKMKFDTNILDSLVSAMLGIKNS